MSAILTIAQLVALTACVITLAAIVAQLAALIGRNRDRD